MSRARAATLLLYALSALLGGCAGSRLASDAPAGAPLAGTWKLDPAASDDPQKVLAHMRTEAIRIINRNNASAQAHGAPDTPPMDEASARGPHRDPLARSPMAHIVQLVAARGDILTVRQSPTELEFDYGGSRRSFTPGGHSVVSAEGGVGDQRSGWSGRDFVIVVKAQAGPEITETYSLTPDGKLLHDKIHISTYELSAVEFTRTYVPTTPSAPHQLPTGD